MDWRVVGDCENGPTGVSKNSSWACWSCGACVFIIAGELTSKLAFAYYYFLSYFSCTLYDN